MLKVLATLCYVSHENRTLMLHRNKRPDDIHYGKWNGLGGKFEAGESPEECAVREIHEESGLSVKNLKLRGLLTFPLFDNKADWYAYVFTASSEGLETVDPDEGTLKWVPNDEILSLNLWPGDKLFLDWLFNDNRLFSGKLLYKDKKLVDHSVSFY